MIAVVFDWNKRECGVVSWEMWKKRRPQIPGWAVCYYVLHTSECHDWSRHVVTFSFGFCVTFRFSCLLFCILVTVISHVFCHMLPMPSCVLAPYGTKIYFQIFMINIFPYAKKINFPIYFLINLHMGSFQLIFNGHLWHVYTVKY